MHSSRMRTARCSGHLSCHARPPPCHARPPPAHMPLRHARAPPPPVKRMTDACENITLPQTLFAGGNEFDVKYYLLTDSLLDTVILTWEFSLIYGTLIEKLYWQLFWFVLDISRLTPIKDQLPDDIEFNHIKIVIAILKRRFGISAEMTLGDGDATTSSHQVEYTVQGYLLNLRSDIVKYVPSQKVV